MKSRIKIAALVSGLLLTTLFGFQNCGAHFKPQYFGSSSADIAQSTGDTSHLTDSEGGNPELPSNQVASPLPAPMPQPQAPEPNPSPVPVASPSPAATPEPAPSPAPIQTPTPTPALTASAPCADGYVRIQLNHKFPTLAQATFSAICVMKYEAKYKVTASGVILDYGWIPSDQNKTKFTNPINTDFSNIATISSPYVPYQIAQQQMPGKVVSVPQGKPVLATYQDSVNACAHSGPDGIFPHLLYHSEWQSIGYEIENTAENWSGGTVGEGQLNRGVMYSTYVKNIGMYGMKATYPATGLSEAPGTWSDSRRWHRLPDGSTIWDFSGNGWEWDGYMDNDFGGTNGLTSPPVVQLPNTAPASQFFNGLTDYQVFGPIGVYPNASAANNYAGFGTNGMRPKTGWINSYSYTVQRGQDGIFSVNDSSYISSMIGAGNASQYIVYGSFRCAYPTN